MNGRWGAVWLLWGAIGGLGCDDPSQAMDGGLPDAVDGGLRDRAGAPGVRADGGPEERLDSGAPRSDHALPRRHAFDPEAAGRGRDVLFELSGTDVPWLALENLWPVWGRPGLSDEAYWSEFSARYGFVPSEDGGPPLGIVRRDDAGSIQCLACHADRVAGQTLIGAGNGRIRLEALYDDLIRLNELAPTFGVPSVPIPDVWDDAFDGRTGAPGATDAMGMGITLATAFAPGADIETRYGFQQPPAWWQIGFKDRIYTDGSAESTGYRTMLATALASGGSLADIQAMEPAIQDLHHYLCSLEPPPWPFDAPDDGVVEEGRLVFEGSCASCHGTYGPEGSFPDTIVDVGTDPIRSERFTEKEAAWINASWFGEPPMEPQEGYLAPPLLGVWATAPYFHNGSVPDLRAVLRPSERPARWRRLRPSEDDYNPERVGVRFEEVAAGGDSYDTTTGGLSSAGHPFGEELSEAQVAALLAYLVTL